jgi:hypothetical protein
MNQDERANRAEDGRWIATDEAEDVAGSVRHALRCLELVNQDDQAWKWVALSLHSALQGACVCHLTTTAVPIGAVTERNAREWWQYFEASRGDRTIRPPETYVLPLPDLIKAVRKPKSAGDCSEGSGVQISDSEVEWLCRFHSTIRNQFVHFSPLGWSIDVSGMPALGELIARVIGAVIDAGWGFRHKGRDWVQGLRADLALLAPN